MFQLNTPICLVSIVYTTDSLHVLILIYRVIHKSLREVRPLRYSSRDGHAEGEHVNRGRDTPKFLSYLTGARYILSAVSVLVVEQPSSEVPEGLMNYSVLSSN
jgi:hypothetical protein